VLLLKRRGSAVPDMASRVGRFPFLARFAVINLVGVAKRSENQVAGITRIFGDHRGKEGCRRRSAARDAPGRNGGPGARLAI